MQNCFENQPRLLLEVRISIGVAAIPIHFAALNLPLKNTVLRLNMFQPGT